MKFDLRSNEMLQMQHEISLRDMKYLPSANVKGLRRIIFLSALAEHP